MRESPHISKKHRDPLKENLFKDSYGLDTQIWVTTFNDENWDWDKVILNFRDSLGKTYGLIEHFPGGKDNNTDYVILEYEQNGKMNTQSYDRFVDAEKEMVAVMKRRLNGDA